MKTLIAIAIVAALSACAGGSHEPTRFEPNFLISIDSGDVT